MFKKNLVLLKGYQIFYYYHKHWILPVNFLHAMVVQITHNHSLPWLKSPDSLSLSIPSPFPHSLMAIMLIFKHCGKILLFPSGLEN